MRSDDDGDGIATATENQRDGDIFGTDVDQDGIPNYLDFDSDGDGEDDLGEGLIDTDGDSIPDYLDNNDEEDSTDADGDTLSNADEILNLTNPLHELLNKMVQDMGYINNQKKTCLYIWQIPSKPPPHNLCKKIWNGLDRISLPLNSFKSKKSPRNRFFEKIEFSKIFEKNSIFGRFLEFWAKNAKTAPNGAVFEKFQCYLKCFKITQICSNKVE